MPRPRKRLYRAGLWSAERTALAMGYSLVAGIDEVGLGPLAGPVVAGAAVLKLGDRLPGLNDSKQLTHEQRLRAARMVYRRAVAVGVGEVPIEEFNRIGMTKARQVAMKRAIGGLGIPVEYLLVDAFDVPESPLPQLGVVKGDRTCASIMAASVVAKVHRDQLMIEFDKLYPGYGFAVHKGYATEAHREALRMLGPSPIHRTSWRRVQELTAALAAELC